MNATVSIVINNYNYARFLGAAIESALGQTYPGVEVVVVDDGSTDGSRAVIESYGGRVRTVFKANGGQGSALNAGFAASTGEIVAWLDADDYFAPHAVERIVAGWEESTQITHHRLQQVDAEGRGAGFYPPAEAPLDAGDVVPLLLARGGYHVPPTSGLAHSRRLLEKILPMPEAEFRICADSYLVTVSPFFAPVTARDETLGFYRVHGGNAHRDADQRRHLSRKKLAAALHYDDVRHGLIRKLAREHGYPEPATKTWLDSTQLFGRLLLRRADAKTETTAARAGVVLAKLWTEPGHRFWARMRQTALTLVVSLAPRFLLRRIYPNLFS